MPKLLSVIYYFQKIPVVISGLGAPTMSSPSFMTLYIVPHLPLYIKSSLHVQKNKTNNRPQMKSLVLSHRSKNQDNI